MMICGSLPLFSLKILNSRDTLNTFLQSKSTGSKIALKYVVYLENDRILGCERLMICLSLIFFSFLTSFLV